MTYYRSYEYGEKYRISFNDVDNNQWRICISKPNYSGNITELKGAELPIEWTGTGDEKQDNVMCGSTGYLRIVCQRGQESIFAVGKLLPENINDCRVQVMRYTENSPMTFTWETYWQGFIKPDVYSQEWDSAPYEIELPIVSAVAAMEYFPMPMPGDNMYSLFMQQTNIAGLLRMIAIAIGCDIRGIYTNKPDYENFNGETTDWTGSGGGVVHWTQGTVSAAYYYNIESGIMKPQTFKDVFENICYPYGKIHDFVLGIAVMMAWKRDVIYSATLYILDVWDDYDSHVISSDVRFGGEVNMPVINMSSLDIAGTDNTFSLIARPSKVTFTKNIDSGKEIFELTDKFIKSTLPIGDSLAGKPIETSIMSGTASEPAITRYVYAIDKQYINKEFGYDWEFTNEWDSTKADIAFCRVVEVTGSNSDAKYSVPVPLGFCFNNHNTSSTSKRALIKFTLQNGIKTKYGLNLLKMSLKSYAIDKKTSVNHIENDHGQSVGVLTFGIEDLMAPDSSHRYLNYNNGSWSWGSTTQQIPVENLPDGSDGFTLLFNEPRSNNDETIHKLRFTLGLTLVEDPLSGNNTYGRMYTMMKLGYTCDTVANIGAVMGTFAESIEKNGNTTEYGGSGEELNIAFKTQCGTKNLIVDGSVFMPKYSFCNAQTYIDSQNREMIDIGAAKFEIYENYPLLFDFVRYYVVVNDDENDKVYVPAAVGMNPRMNTLRLKLISTNVTS